MRMSAKIIDGRGIAVKMAEELNVRVEALKVRGVVPKLVWMRVGSNGANRLYGKIKGEKAKELGLDFEAMEFEEFDVAVIRKRILGLNGDPNVHGIMLQLPVEVDGVKINESQLTELLVAIDPMKDVDCLTPENLGRVLIGSPVYLPATVESVVRLLEEVVYMQANLTRTGSLPRASVREIGEVKDWLKGKRVVVVGGGLEIGKPLVGLVSNLGATVLWARSAEGNLQEITLQADVVVSATGKVNLITGEMVKDGVVAIDVGAPKGDFEIESVIEKASFISPVPGGVGPVTVMSLMENVVKAAEIQNY